MVLKKLQNFRNDWSNYEESNVFINKLISISKLRYISFAFLFPALFITVTFLVNPATTIHAHANSNRNPHHYHTQHIKHKELTKRQIETRAPQMVASESKRMFNPKHQGCTLT